MYDWANSVYTLVIGTAIFPIYYAAVMEGAGIDTLNIFGAQIDTTAAYTFVIALAYLTVSVATPYLSALSEVSGSKKTFMRILVWLGSLSAMGMFWFVGERHWLGLVAPYFGTLGFAGSLVFYNSYLPEIADPKDQDHLSARGFALGYIGSVLLLIVSLACIQNPAWFGLEDVGLITRYTFVAVAIWWAGWGEYSLVRLPEGHAVKVKEKGWIKAAYQQLWGVYLSFRERAGLQRFVIGFFFASAGIQTVILIATLFGSEELGLDASLMILTIIVIQFLGVAGSYFFSWLSGRVGNIFGLLAASVVWVVVCIMAYFIDNATQFIILGGTVGLVFGGLQSLARSTYSKLLPEEGEHVTYFSFYDIAEKLATTLGMISVGWVIEWTGDMRATTLMLGLFFVIAISIWMSIKHKQLQAL